MLLVKSMLTTVLLPQKVGNTQFSWMPFYAVALKLDGNKMARSKHVLVCQIVVRGITMNNVGLNWNTNCTLAFKAILYQMCF